MYFQKKILIISPGIDICPGITGGCVFVTMLVSYLLPLFSQSSVGLCNPMNCSTPGFPVHHCPLELAQIHVH